MRRSQNYAGISDYTPNTIRLTEYEDVQCLDVLRFYPRSGRCWQIDLSFPGSVFLIVKGEEHHHISLVVVNDLYCFQIIFCFNLRDSRILLTIFAASSKVCSLLAVGPVKFWHDGTTVTSCSLQRMAGKHVTVAFVFSPNWMFLFTNYLNSSVQWKESAYRKKLISHRHLVSSINIKGRFSKKKLSIFNRNLELRKRESRNCSSSLFRLLTFW